MDAAQSLHPTDQTLRSYGLGKLDDRSAEAVNEHLMECSDCRKRVAETSADSFLQRVRDAQRPSEKPKSGQPQAGGTLTDQEASTTGPPSDDSIPPSLLNHPDYEIKRELGRGGMGVVYLAHNKLMARDEVLKVMGQHLMDYPGVLERFVREIQSVARLRHPNIVTAHHATRLGKSIVFAMEYVEGLDLSRLVEIKGPMPVAHACLFIHQAALGLQHAHEEGLVHRDIKPSNLMLSRKGNTATVKILDFGLAKAAREEKVEGGLTSPGQALGTPTYIAPEQITDALSADIRADIYSLGGTLYYLLAGRPPFQAKTLYDLYQAHISRIADPLNRVRPDVPAEFAALVAKMLAKDPAQRFQTPGEVARALKPFCTKANAALKINKADVPETEQAKSGRSVAEAASATTQLETDADRRIVRPAKTAGSSVAESRWESMIDFEQTERELEAATDVAPTRWRPWVWSSVAVGVLILSVFAALLGGVFKVKTSDGKGMIVLENVPKDSEILVDGDKITFAWPGVGKPVEIRAVPGQHKLEVKKDGFKTFVDKEVTFKTDESEEVIVRLEPIDVDPTKVKKLGGEPPVPPAAQNLIPPAGPARRAHYVKGALWTVEGDQLVKKGLEHGWLGFGDPGWTDYDLTLEVRKSESPDGIGVGFRVSEGRGYVLGIGVLGNKHNLHHWSNSGMDNREIRSKPGTIEPDEWYKLKISLRGPRILIELDNHLLFALTDDFHQKGFVGFHCFNCAGGFRNIKVTAPDGTVLWEGPPDLREK
jgi:serine/threonine protein kinase